MFRSVVLLSAMLLAIPRPVMSQTYWRAPAGLGGALAGAGIGWAVDIARWGMRDLRGPSLTLTPIGLGVGGVLGFMGGLSADHRLARGDTLSRGARRSLRLATFLAPVAVGSTAAFAIINPSDQGRCVPYRGPNPDIICTFEPAPRKIISDELAALIGIGGGAIIGFVAQRKFAGALWPRARVGLAPDGRGLGVSLSTDW